MSFGKIKAAFTDSVNYVVSGISQYTVTPGRDFTRSRKMEADKLIFFLVSCGSSSTKIELLDFFGLQADSPSASAFNQQRTKLLPLRYNNDKRKKPLFSRGLSVCRHLFNSFSKLKSDEKNIEKRRLFH